jgi:hypothetical protein
LTRGGRLTYISLPLKRPTGVTIIAIMLFLGAVSVVLIPGGVRYRGIGTVRGVWVFALSGLYIALGVGLLRLRPWARIATIANEILHVGFFGVALVNGLLQARPIFVFARLLNFPLDVIIVWYLLKPNIERVFTHTDL